MGTQKRELNEFLKSVIIAIVLGGISVFIFFFVARGAEDTQYTQKMLIYLVIFALLIIVFGIMKFYEYNTKGLSAQTLLHDPDKPFAFLAKTSDFVRNPLKLVLISILLFSWYSFIISQLPQTAFVGKTGVPILKAPQQIYESGRILSFVEPAATVETWLYLVLFMGFGLTGVWFLSKKNKKIYSFLVYLILIPLAILFMVQLHKLVYGGQDIANAQVGIFWGFGTFITLATGSIFPFWVWHWFNNLYSGLAITYSSEKYLIIASIIQILMTFAVIGLLFLMRKKKSLYPASSLRGG